MIVDRIGQPLVTSTKRRQFSDFFPSVTYFDPSSAATVAPSATAHTKGSWVEVVASTSKTTNILQVLAGDTYASGQANGGLMDIGVGAAASEVVVAANVPVGNHQAIYASSSVAIPLQVARGSRVAVRWQSARASAGSATVTVVLSRWPTELGVYSPTTIDTIGANTGTTGGVSAGITSGAWVEMSAAAAQAYQGFITCITSNDTTMLNSPATVITIDVGVGASGSERAVVSSSAWFSSNTETYFPWSNTGLMSGFLPIRCPKGARIAARMNDSNISGNSPEIVLLGVPYG